MCANGVCAVDRQTARVQFRRRGLRCHASLAFPGRSGGGLGRVTAKTPARSFIVGRCNAVPDARSSKIAPCHPFGTRCPHNFDTGCRRERGTGAPADTRSGGTRATPASRTGHPRPPPGLSARPPNRGRRACQVGGRAARRSRTGSTGRSRPPSPAGGLRSRRCGWDSRQRATARGAAPPCPCRSHSRTAATAVRPVGRCPPFRSPRGTRPAPPGSSWGRRLAVPRLLPRTGPPAHPDRFAGHRSTTRDVPPCASSAGRRDGAGVRQTGCQTWGVVRGRGRSS